MSGVPFRLVPAGDSTVIVELEDRIDERINAQAIRLAAAIESGRIAGVRDVVPTYRTVAVYFDPLRTDYTVLEDLLEREAGSSGPPQGGPHTRDLGSRGTDVGSSETDVGSAFRRIDGTNVGSSETDVGSGFSRITDPPVSIPVCYGGELGPDLGDVATQSRLSEAEVIARHSSATYRVFMMGFVPGFAYLGTVDPAIAVPRRATPRVRVPMGSVGIAGAQTGIYPLETPGGWQLVGRTPLKLFDLTRANPFLLKPGDAVRFHPITASDYERAAAN